MGSFVHIRCVFSYYCLRPYVIAQHRLAAIILKTGDNVFTSAATVARQQRLAPIAVVLLPDDYFGALFDTARRQSRQ